MNRHPIVTALASAILIVALPLAAQESGKQDEQKQQQPDPRTELKKRMTQRHAGLEKLRDAEKIGETHAGLVEAIKPATGKEKIDPADPKSGTVGELLDAENKDRKALYALLAKDLKVTPDEIGKQNGIRTLQKAADEHWLKLVDGTWAQKKAIRTEKNDKKT